jgi:hypothetical protein
MVTQLQLTTQALAQGVKDQTLLAQQVALALEGHNHQVGDDSRDPGGTTIAHPCRNAHPPPTIR